MIRRAPIVLFVYNRLDHAMQTVQALQENYLAGESELYIYADAAKNPEAEPAVARLRDYLPSITGFKAVHIRLRKNNLGVDENVMQGVTEVINEQGRVIVLEDDLITSPWFLQFMNEALDYYKDEEEVISVHGYIYPVRQALRETFFLKGADCWGWATWKRGWDLFERDGRILLDKLKASGLQEEFNFDNAYPYTEALERQAMGNSAEWDIRWYASAFLAEKLTLFPGQSLVKNIGHDASGTHCGVSNLYDVNLAQSPIAVQTEVKPDQDAYLAYVDFLSNMSSDTVLKGWLSRSFKKLKSSLGKLLTKRNTQ